MTVVNTSSSPVQPKAKTHSQVNGHSGQFPHQTISEDDRANFRKVIVGGLSRADLLLITLYYVDHLSTKEIAAQVSRTQADVEALLQTTKSLLHITMDSPESADDETNLTHIVNLLCYRLAEDERRQYTTAVLCSLGELTQAELRTQIARCRVARVFRDLNLCTGDEALYLVADPLMRLADRQVEAEYDNPRSILGRLGSAMVCLEEMHELPAGKIWTLEQAPLEYLALNAKWNERKRQIIASVFHLFGERLLSRQLEENPALFERRFQNGKSRFMHTLRQWRRHF